MKGYKKIGLLFIAVLFLFLFEGCSWIRRTEPQQKPPIPQKISQGEGKEPALEVYIVEEQTTRDMPLEEYLVGVVAGEMKVDWPVEALEAQAILARTYVLEFIASGKESKYGGAHISTDIEEAQAWNAEAVNDRVRQAVRNTRGQVLVHNNNYVKAWFHAHAGGKTATAEEGLNYQEGPVPYIEVVNSPDSEEAPEEDANWRETFTKAEIIQAVNKMGEDPGDFNEIQILEKGPSGRVTKLAIGNAVVNAPEFRIALDSTRMKSTQIKEITVEGNSVTISGIGYGHGVGMSQWGAYEMAKQGADAEYILNHYFKNVNIVKLWD